MPLKVVLPCIPAARTGKIPRAIVKASKSRGRHLKFANGTKPTRVRECTPEGGFHVMFTKRRPSRFSGRQNDWL